MASLIAINLRKTTALESLIVALEAACSLTGEPLELPNMTTPQANTDPLAQAKLLESVCAASVAALGRLQALCELQAAELAKAKSKSKKVKADNDQTGDEGSAQ